MLISKVEHVRPELTNATDKVQQYWREGTALSAQVSQPGRRECGRYLGRGWRAPVPAGACKGRSYCRFALVDQPAEDSPATCGSMSRLCDRVIGSRWRAVWSTAVAADPATQDASAPTNLQQASAVRQRDRSHQPHPRRISPRQDTCGSGCPASRRHMSAGRGAQFHDMRPVPRDRRRTGLMCRTGQVGYPEPGRVTWVNSVRLRPRTFSYPTGFVRIPWGNSYFGDFHFITPIQRERRLNWATGGFHSFER